MKKTIILFITLIYSQLTYSAEYKCSDIKEREISVNSQTDVKVQTINGVCSFSVETSKDIKKSDYSSKEYHATRDWIFQSSGKILIHNSYGTGPTDSSSTAYKGYQMFPNNKELKIHTNDDESFSIQLANGSNIYFNANGSIDKKKTVDLKIKDTPISIPNIPKEKSSEKYEEMSNVSYRDRKKSSIRVYHRQLYASETSKSIGLETKKGMYIPLGIEMGKIPGNSTTASYTLFGVDDEKLCSQKMPAHYFFNYQVRCSSNSPNELCACKYTDEKAQELMKINYSYEDEIRKVKRSINNAQSNEIQKLQDKLLELEGKYNPKLYSEIYFTCSLDKKDALKFIAGKKISGDNREVEGVSVKDTDLVINGLINSNKCNNLKRAYHDCAECFEKDILKMKYIEDQEEVIQKVLEQI